MIVIPAIDLRQGNCVRLTQGRKDAATVYDGDPVKVAEGFERDGARMIHVVDLDGAFSESNGRNREVLRDLVGAVSIPVQFGGGLRGAKDVEQVISLGVDRVVIGTLAVESPELLAKFVGLFGADHLAVGIDARNGQVMTRGWETEEQMTALTLAQRVAAAGVERIIYTDVSRDGMLTGVNIDQTCLVAETSGLKITASGGVASLNDLELLRAVSHRGVDSVIVGKALYEGRFTLPDAIAICA
ncbi:MAG: phosphoribosylformimino-5-aminoimidazole carboxamide ribotide isomerase [Blastocatellia bacterium]|jgi:phosphoribosylformimino-5-aminoimidazole carboxamide ribotide isomerase|nr:phosphoribosylformimino-5-aminoimidazole carboxamide ribotide isomerase [Blastocatellia bacterium]